MNRTGLTGTFDLKLSWTNDPDSPSSTADMSVTGNDADASIVSALQEQLGLKLRQAKGNIEILVIDRVERPSPD